MSPLRPLYILLLTTQAVVAVETDTCSYPLGMEDGRISDSQITASGWLSMNRNPSTSYRPNEARLNFNRGSKGWCSNVITNERTQESRIYLQVDLLKNTRVTGLAIQNGPTNIMRNYKILFQRADDTFFREYALNWKPEVFPAVGLPDRVSTMVLPVPLVGRVIRIVPILEPTTQYCCIRIELYGCEWDRQRDGLLSYVAPAGNKYGELPLQDSSYDGAYLTLINKLTGGLGRLTDGVIGQTLNAPTSSYQWVGYRSSLPVVTFKFAGRRFFRHLVVHSINYGDSISVFSKVEVLVVGSGRKDFPLLVVTSTDTQRRTVGSVALQIDIQHAGDEIQMQFFQLKEWLLISEIEVYTEKSEPLDESKRIWGVVPGTSDPERFPTEQDDSGDSKNSVHGKTTSSAKKPISFPIIVAAALGGGLVLVAVIIYAVVRSRRRNEKKQPEKSTKLAVPCQSHQSVLLSSSPTYSSGPPSDTQTLLWTEHMAGIRSIDRQGHLKF